MTNPLRSLALSCGTAVALATLPATAVAGESNIPPLPLSVSSEAPAGSCGVARVRFRKMVGLARDRRRAALVQIRDVWHRSAIDDLARLSADLQTPAGESERIRAQAKYEMASADNRARRRTAAQSARRDYRRILGVALDQHRANLQTCR